MLRNVIEVSARSYRKVGRTAIDSALGSREKLMGEGSATFEI